MEATSSSDTSVDFKRNKRRYIPEDRTLVMNKVRQIYVILVAFRFWKHSHIYTTALNLIE
jgi:hypothetical protein